MTAFNTILYPFWTGMLEHLWQSTLVIVPLLFLGRFMVGSRALLFHGFWWVVFAKLLLPLSLLGPAAHRVAGSLMAALGIQGSLSTTTLTRVTAFLSPLEVTAHATWAPGTLTGVTVLVATIAWICGTSWLGFKLVIELLETRSSMANDGSGIESGNRTSLEIARQIAGVDQERLTLSKHARVPAVAGILTPRIRIPFNLVDAMTTDELSAILIHEAEHCRRRHPAHFLAMRIVHCLFFFYPLVPVLLRRLSLSCEYLCDEAVLNRGIRPEVYAHALLRTVQLGLSPSPSPSALGHSASQLRERLVRINENRKVSTMFKHHAIAFGALLFVTAGSFSPLSLHAMLEGQDIGNTEAAALPAVGSRTETLPAVAPLPAPSQQHTDGAVLPYRMAGAGNTTDPTERPEVDMLSLKPTHKVGPAYPKRGKENLVEGKVILKALVGKEGSVKVLEVLEGVEGYPEFAESAITALEQWKFEPYVKDGKAIEVTFVQPVNFKLK